MGFPDKVLKTSPRVLANLSPNSTARKALSKSRGNTLPAKALYGTEIYNAGKASI